jgi:hypothetical protein
VESADKQQLCYQINSGPAFHDQKKLFVKRFNPNTGKEIG